MSKNIVDLEIPVKSQSRSLKVVTFDRFGMVSYFIVTLSLRRTIFEIFDFKKFRDFDNPVKVLQSH